MRASMGMRISTKLVLAVLTAVALPFLGFAIAIDTLVVARLRDMASKAMLGLTGELARQLDELVDQRNQDLALWSGDLLCAFAAQESLERPYDPAAAEPSWGPAAQRTRALGERETYADATFRPYQAEQFDRYLAYKHVYDLLILVDANGRLVASSSLDPQGRVHALAELEQLYARDYANEDWWQQAMRGEFARVDQHVSDLLPAGPESDDSEPLRESLESRPSRYHLGFGVPVIDPGDPERVLAVLYALVNWRHVQHVTRTAAVVETLQGLVGPDDYPSAYAWIWAADADRILAHKDYQLYGERVSGPRVGLPVLVETALSAPEGLFHPYVFRGTRKIAAFSHCAGPEQGGFGWVLGVGIDDDDIYAQVAQIRGLLYKSTAAVLLVVVLWTLVIARRTTAPILALRAHTQRVAGGDLDARIESSSGDELGELARSFNEMTSELKLRREQLVRAEKDAAWREMARQVAHDLKNPLTPIKLSLDLLERARRDNSPQAGAILESTLSMMRRQVENLREVATDFYEFTGGRKPRIEPVELAEVIDEVYALNAAWAGELGVALVRDGGGRALADRGKLRRVLENLVSNALQATRGTGGRVEARIAKRGEQLELEIVDEGSGIAPEARAHLFEPYFPTRSQGTGLGLAIARRIVEELGGSIELEPRASGPGTVARVRLPRAPSA